MREPCPPGTQTTTVCSAFALIQAFDRQTREKIYIINDISRVKNDPTTAARNTRQNIIRLEQEQQDTILNYTGRGKVAGLVYNLQLAHIRVRIEVHRDEGGGEWSVSTLSVSTTPAASH